ncbi:hypothetical protein FQN57_006594 [Myotisia sp. PD_48]|nr:hypothetical protein FQN57_006594 [Myotisia sp. PD_48]
MSRILDSPARNPFNGGPGDPSTTKTTRTIPLLASTVPPAETSPGDPMDVSPSTTTSMAPPLQSSPDMDATNSNNSSGSSTDLGLPQNAMNSNQQPIGAAAAGQQPKVVQTAFIHKLYSMLQDPSIQHLISWSSSNESFVMLPSSDFSKVLAQYFKHTNISSFVRQLNMYGFHKVSDVFHNGSPDSPMWEFRHGNGSFRKGDVAGLRDIKRRASRHALIHRDSFQNHKQNLSQPGTPAEPLPDGLDRMASFEQSLYDVHSRLTRMEDHNALLSSRCQMLTESLIRCHQWTSSMSSFITSLAPDTPDNIHRDAANLHREITRQLEHIRALESPQEPLIRHQFFSNAGPDGGPPLSPRQLYQDESRRPSSIRHHLPTHLSVSPRHGSIGGPNQPPTHNKSPAPPPPQPAPHPLSAVSSPPGLSLGRRHTSADIRQHGWAASAPPTNNSHYAAGATPPQWPPSPNRGMASVNEQHVRDTLARYELGGARRHHDVPRNATPPLMLDPIQQDSGWSLGGPKFPRPVESLPATRRSSMASNVHSLLNPAGAAARAEENDGLSAGEDRKRKRLL